MTTVWPIDLECPCCHKKIYTYDVGSTNSFGEMTTDFRQKALGDQPSNYALHTCRSCSFTGTFHEIETARLSVQDKIFIRIRLYLRYRAMRRQGPFHPGNRFELYAILKEREGWSNRKLGDLYLQAAWASSDYSIERDEYKYRMAAVACYKRVLANSETNPCTNTLIIYLIGEQFRRVHETETADQWFDQAIIEAEKTDQSALADLARQQKTEPKDMFDRDDKTRELLSFIFW